MRAGNDVLTFGLEETNFTMKTIGNTIHKFSLGGLPVDLLGYPGAIVIFDVGDWYDGVHTFGLQHSPDGVEWDAVDASDYEGTLPVVESRATQRQVTEVLYKGGRKYLRAIVDIESGGDGAMYGVIIIRSSGLAVSIAGTPYTGD
jgi:hypothetical protein